MRTASLLRLAAATLACALSCAPSGAAPPGESGGTPPSSRSWARSDELLRSHLWEQVRALPRGERPTVGVVLSAGAVRGLAHVGVLQVLQDAGFPIDAVAGTSMGAVIGALYSAGLDMERLRSLPERLTFRAGSDYTTFRLIRLFLADSPLSTEKFEGFITQEIGEKRFEELRTPFACVSMDLRTGEKIIFREGPVAPAVRASSNLPGLFKPVLYRHRYLVDGGVVDYIPIDAVQLLGADWVLASVTEGDFSRSMPTNMASTLSQIFDIRGALLSRQQRRQAQVLIEPDVGQVDFRDVTRAYEVIEKGMQATTERLPAAEESLILATLPGLMKRWSPKP